MSDPLRRRSRLDLAPGAGAVLLALAVLAPGACAQQSGAGTTLDDAGLIERANASRAKGADDAAITVYELSDFQCPFCARFTLEVLPQIQRDYIATGRVRWVFLHYPLPMHERAWVAAEAATCAGGTGGDFWEVHDRLFQDQRTWGEAEDPGPLLRGYALAAGAEEGAYDACVAGDRVASILTQDLLSASGTGARGTPAFVVAEQELVVGVKPFEEWREILERHIAAAAAPPADTVPPGR